MKDKTKNKKLISKGSYKDEGKLAANALEYREGREKKPEIYSGASGLEEPRRKERPFTFTSVEKVLEYGM